jgi:VIT1/CCC1 family predicted Fe2+/Mn2+ transporter
MQSALMGSIVLTVLALLVFGYIKGLFTVRRPMRSAWHTAAVGSIAAAAAFIIAKLVG